MKNKKILIVDDSELNRALLIDMLEDQYEIEEAINGEEAINILKRRAVEFSLILLDIMMPKANGFAVLEYMKKHHMMDSIAVIMISSDDSNENIQKAYEMGAFDYISRPFEFNVVRHRVSNTMLLYTKQNKLEDIVLEQIYEQQKNSKLMISILSHIVEFRNNESGHHITSVGNITEILLRQLVRITNKYSLTSSEISLISTASALHDIGKISIPDEILNKPGRLTSEEFEKMKTHSAVGAEMLHALSEEEREADLVKRAYEICRWHHERYDGNGYPDGLKGDDIPISAQVVALADIYDALTSERCYKNAYSHSEAIHMIINGECGAFNPVLLERLKLTEKNIEKMANKKILFKHKPQTLQSIRDKLNSYELDLGKRNMDLLNFEQQKSEFFSEISDEILFSYNNETSILSLNSSGAEKLGLQENIISPETNDIFRCIFDKETIKYITKEIKKSSPDQTDFNMNIFVFIDGKKFKYNCIGKTIWTPDTKSRRIGVVGKLIENN